jgi:hypothetical protein
LVTTGVAVVTGGISVAMPNMIALSSPDRPQSVADVRLAPLSPPPRPTHS